ncbi:hypothetical protein KF7_0776 [Lactococcus lactis subsp. lactis]|nr:hypothetical protein KF7_0776 [Lactococcus lactis subsp. lactis]
MFDAYRKFSKIIQRLLSSNLLKKVKKLKSVQTQAGLIF